MRNVNPGALSIFLTLLAGILFSMPQICELIHMGPMDPDLRPLLRSAAQYAFEGAIVLIAIFLYVPHRAGAEVLAKAWTERLHTVSVEIMDRAESAREAIDKLANAGQIRPEKLPQECTSEFSDVASFCAGWRSRDRRRYWSKSLVALLEISNQALFDFLLTLEINGPPDLETLSRKKLAAVSSLDQVIQALKKTLLIPSDYGVAPDSLRSASALTNDQIK